MASKHRITITIDEEPYRCLKTISACSGDSMSGAIRDILDISLPTLKSMALMMEEVKNIKNTDMENIEKTLLGVADKLEPINSALLGIMEDTGEVLAYEKKPPRTNRGVRMKKNAKTLTKKTKKK
jgi:hypothetical protein